MISKLDTASVTHQGRRPYQEDHHCSAILEGGRTLLTCIADGMGGHNNGKKSSKAAAVNFIKCAIAADEVKPYGALLKRCLQVSVETVLRVNRTGGDNQISGCTLLACIITDTGVLHWASVGDSPLYRYSCNQKALFRLNQDHSMRTLLEGRLLRGEISQTDYNNNGSKNVLLSALAEKPPERIDLPSIHKMLEVGDIVLAATDGVLSLSAEEIEGALGTLHNETSARICEALMEQVLAKKRPKQDNVTISITKYLP